MKQVHKIKIQVKTIILKIQIKITVLIIQNNLKILHHYPLKIIPQMLLILMQFFIKKDLKYQKIHLNTKWE